MGKSPNMSQPLEEDMSSLKSVTVSGTVDKYLTSGSNPIISPSMRGHPEIRRTGIVERLKINQLGLFGVSLFKQTSMDS